MQLHENAASHKSLVFASVLEGEGTRHQSGMLPLNSIISSKADTVKAATEYRILHMCVCAVSTDAGRESESRR